MPTRTDGAGVLQCSSCLQHPAAASSLTPLPQLQPTCGYTGPSCPADPLWDAANIRALSALEPPSILPIPRRCLHFILFQLSDLSSQSTLMLHSRNQSGLLTAGRHFGHVGEGRAPRSCLPRRAHRRTALTYISAKSHKPIRTTGAAACR